MIKKAVAYLRVSSAGQSEDGFSLDEQIQKIKIYAFSNNIDLDFSNIFTDVESGSNPSRAQLNTMKDFVLNPKNNITHVLVYAIDRWTRNAVEGLKLFDLLLKQKIQLVSVSEYFDSSTPMGKFLCGLLHLLAELNKDNIIKKLTSGKQQMVQQTGKWAGGISPYGYKAVGRRRKRNEEAIVNGRGQLEINEDEAKAVQLIYTLKDQNYSYSQICETLTAKNYYNRYGRPFNKGTIYRILNRKEIYSGKKHINRSIALNDDAQPQQPSVINAE